MRKHVVLPILLLVVCGVAQAQWQMQHSGTTADLRGIDNVGSGVAWASGTDGTVLRTEDGGYLWQNCAVPPGAAHLDFRGIQAFDANTAIVMSSGKGDLSRLCKTTDGCQTWKLVFTNPDAGGFWDAINFDSGGSLLGDPVNGMFTLFHSDDLGSTWTRQINDGLKDRRGSESVFAASNSSLAGQFIGPMFVTGGPGGAVLYSQVSVWGGFEGSPETLREALEGRFNTWDHHSIPVGTASPSAGAFSVATIQSLPQPRQPPPKILVIVVVGGDYTKPDDQTSTAAYSIDQGVSWISAQTMPHGYRSAVAYDAASKTWITVGPNGTDISTDDGRNWRALHPDPAMHEPPDADRDWNALSLPFVVGPHGRIGKLNLKALAINEGK